MADDINTSADLTSLTADVVSAYVSNNSVTPDELSKLIASTYEALNAAGKPVVPAAPEFAKADKAAIKKSAQPDFLTSFIDGRKYKSLKRHLSTNGLSPDEYRQRYGLPKDYPMVAAGYSAQRSELAKSHGLGRKAGETVAKPEPKAAGKGRGKPIKPQDESFS